MRFACHALFALAFALLPFGALPAQTAAPDSTTPPEALVPQTSSTAPAAPLNLPTPANPALRSLFLVGDSTVRNGRGDGANGQWGWGEPLAALFDTSKINVVNRALGGRSSRTYITEGHWAATLALLKPGDIVLFQFGHNDSGPLDDPARARGTLPGVSDDTREIENPLLHAHEVVHTYGWYLRDYVVETIARGATPVLCTPIPRKLWNNGKVERNAENYGGWARAIAIQQRVPLLDLNEIIAAKYEALGPPAVEPLFADPPNPHQPGRRRTQRRSRRLRPESPAQRPARRLLLRQRKQHRTRQPRGRRRLTHPSRRPNQPRHSLGMF